MRSKSSAGKHARSLFFGRNSAGGEWVDFARRDMQNSRMMSFNESEGVCVRAKRRQAHETGTLSMAHQRRRLATSASILEERCSYHPHVGWYTALARRAGLHASAWHTSTIGASRVAQTSTSAQTITTIRWSSLSRSVSQLTVEGHPSGAPATLVPSGRMPDRTGEAQCAFEYAVSLRS